MTAKGSRLRRHASGMAFAAVAFAFTCALALVNWVIFQRWYMPVLIFTAFGVGIALAEWQCRRRDRRGA